MSALIRKSVRSRSFRLKDPDGEVSGSRIPIRAVAPTEDLADQRNASLHSAEAARSRRVHGPVGLRTQSGPIHAGDEAQRNAAVYADVYGGSTSAL